MKIIGKNGREKELIRKGKKRIEEETERERKLKKGLVGKRSQKTQAEKEEAKTMKQRE